MKGLKLMLPLWPLSHQICQDDRTSMCCKIPNKLCLDCYICAIASCLEKRCDAFASPPRVQLLHNPLLDMQSSTQGRLRRSYALLKSKKTMQPG